MGNLIIAANISVSNGAVNVKCGMFFLNNMWPSVPVPGSVYSLSFDSEGNEKGLPMASLELLYLYYLSLLIRVDSTKINNTGYAKSNKSFIKLCSSKAAFMFA